MAAKTDRSHEDEESLSRLLDAKDQTVALAQKLESPNFDGLTTVDGLVSPEFVGEALSILQKRETEAGKPLNAAGLELWSAEYQALFKRIGERLWSALKSSEGFGGMRKSLELSEGLDNPLVVVDGYAIRYVALQDGEAEATGLDDSHPTHKDDCSLTVNLCLGVEPFTGGQLEFQQGWPPDLHTAVYEHKTGRALVHPGKIAHRALPMLSGTRYHLIIWYDTIERQAAAKRTGLRILEELVLTERSYLQHLKKLTDVFGELRRASKVVEELFDEVDKMLVFHESLLQTYERMNKIANSTESFEPAQHQEFCEALNSLRLLFLENLHHYAKYVCNHEAVVRICSEDKKAKKILAKISSDSQIFEHLICPIRRIPRYTLLFRDLDRHYNKQFHISRSTSHVQLDALRQVIADLTMAASNINENLRRNQPQ